MDVGQTSLKQITIAQGSHLSALLTCIRTVWIDAIALLVSVTVDRFSLFWKGSLSSFVWSHKCSVSWSLSQKRSKSELWCFKCETVTIEWAGTIAGQALLGPSETWPWTGTDILRVRNPRAGGSYMGHVVGGWSFSVKGDFGSRNGRGELQQGPCG